MQIDVLASSSAGNAYIVSDGETSILLEAGIPYKEMQIKSDFKVNECVACFVSHAHQDHAKAVKDLLGSAIDVYALPETLSVLGVSEHHRVHSVEPMKLISINTFDVMARALKSGLEDIGFTEGTISVSEHGYCAIGKRENVKVQIDGRWDGQL